MPVVTGEWRLGDVRHVTASAERAAAVLGFRAEVGFAAGMADFATAPLREPLPPGEPQPPGEPLPPESQHPLPTPVTKET